MRVWIRSLLAISFLVLVSGCATPPKTFIKTFDEPGIWKAVELREGLGKDEVWRLVVDTLSQRYDLEVLQKESGYIRTSWQYTIVTPRGRISPEYRSRIVIKFLGDDWKTAQVKCESNWYEEGGWVMGYDTRILEDVYGDLQGKIGRVRR